MTASLTGVSAVFYAGYYCDFAQVIDNLVGTQHFTGAIMSGDGSDEPQFITSLSTQADGNGVLAHLRVLVAVPGGVDRGVHQARSRSARTLLRGSV